MSNPGHRTIFFEKHQQLGASIVEFGGWDMPIQYKTGIVKEHLATRTGAGLFDVSHMGRFVISGNDALPCLQYVLTNNAAALETGEAQYTIIANETGGAIDDAYLYRFVNDEYILVVNAANREKDWAHFQQYAQNYDDLNLVDKTFDTAMVSFQGPGAKEILNEILDDGMLPEPMRNQMSIVTISGVEVRIGRTGYTGEPICFELFFENAQAPALWDLLLEKGATPIGLGARDTLRLEAALPLYGHELGTDADGQEIPVFAIPLARFAVSLSPLKGDFIGRAPLTRQQKAFKKILDRDYSALADLPRMIKPMELTGKGVARAGSLVYVAEQQVGYITSPAGAPSGLRWLTAV